MSEYNPSSVYEEESKKKRFYYSYFVLRDYNNSNISLEVDSSNTIGLEQRTKDSYLIIKRIFFLDYNDALRVVI